MEKLKFSDRFMMIPIRMYQADEIEELLERKEFGSKEPIDPNFVVGYAKISPYDIMEWYDSFSRPRTIDDVKDEGFDCVRIKTRSGDIYDCIWSREKFEGRLNKFVEKLEEVDGVNEEDLEI